MKTKKCGVFAALAVTLLITAALIVSCVKPVDSSGLSVPQGVDKETLVPPPPGKAYLRVSLPDAARTILPTDPGSTVFYKVEIIDTGAALGNDFGNAHVSDGTVNFGGNTEAFTVDAGTYDVTVSAYTTSAFTTGTLIAIGQDLGRTVTAGTGGTASVTLAKIVDGSANGTFSYNLTLPGGDNAPATASISVTKYSDGTPVTLTQPNLLTSASGSITTIPSGYYWVKVAMTKAQHAPVTYSNILHVLAGHTSSWGIVGTPIVLPNLNKNAYDIEYNLNYGTATPLKDTRGGLGFAHGGTTTKFATYATDPLRSGYTFDDWYTEAGAVTPWVFGASGSLIYKDTTLYANWINDGDELTITITTYSFNESEKSFGLTNPTETFTQTAALGGLSLNVTVVATPFDGGTVNWIYDGNLVLTGNALTTAAINTFNTTVADADLTDDIERIDLSVGGRHTFTITGLVGGVPYNGEFAIIITN